MAFIDRIPNAKHLALKPPRMVLQEYVQQFERPEYKVPVLPSAISMNNPFNIGSVSPAPIGSISAIDNLSPPPSVEDHTSVPNKPSVTLQEQRPESKLSFWDKLSRFSDSDVSKKIDDFLLGAISASPDSTGWQLFAKGLHNLREGDKQREQVNQTVEYLKSQGMSEEEAQLMAGNKNAFNAFLAQKVNGGNGLSSKAELDRQRQMIELKNSEAISSHMLNDIKRFMDYVKKDPDWNTGNLASAKAYLMFPQHRDMKSLLDSIKGRIGIDRLETMRQYSRNGASGFGNLTEKELDILQSYLGGLDYSLSGQELMHRLQAIDKILRKMKSNVLSLLESNTIQLTEENVRRVTSETASTTPQKMSDNLPVVTSKEDIKNLPVGNRAIVQYGHDSFEIVRDR
ncbi:hypothetical protein MEI_00506 [Bartonella vinsonii subsp. arupensis Pm136co]|uniref:Uncharacterized protein n=1 Tax=Bartonella vinsonii subsp. arupensis Pm136co TaxID=1094561 RepID=A0ABN0GQQ0_BARVI|nr:hypothetical protein [Bartonella vinsonii]EJF98498.1 hypothetical protein MEI_00506 [Bartonella vinsonii subsp. arupensis Pm136co]